MTSALINSSTLLKYALRRSHFSRPTKTFVPSRQRASIHTTCKLRRNSKTSGEMEGSNSSVAFSAAAMTVTLTGGASVSLDESKGSTVNCEGRKSEGFPEESLKYDTYNGVTLKVANLGLENGLEEEFGIMLQNSLRRWKEDGKRGIWMHVPTEKSSVVPILTQEGFEFQYAKKGLLVMTKWLPEDSESRLPHGPTHQVGIGAIITHPLTGKMLVVQEKSGPAAAIKLWKMPTGLTDPGEDVVDAAIREAKEETGLDCVFDKIICMRQAHGGIYNQSDMFFVCLLKLDPKYEKMGNEIELKPQEEEIKDIGWMDFTDFTNQNRWQGSPLYEEMHKTIQEAIEVSRENSNGAEQEHGEHDSKEKMPSSHGMVAKSLEIGWRPGTQTIYVSRL